MKALYFLIGLLPALGFGSVASSPALWTASVAHAAEAADLPDSGRLAVCGGDMWFLYLSFKKTSTSPSGVLETDTKKLDQIHRLGDWFVENAGKIMGSKEKATAYAANTMKFHSEAAQREGMRSVLLDLVANSSDCVSLAQRIVPEAPKCFVLSPNRLTGLGWDFQC